ncbi:MAG: alpha/beta hydrolase [Nocardioides sp.]|nr:alpha/beta hydrolase [Nocardioides sp.]
MTARRLRGRAGAAAVVLAVAGSLLSCADGSDARPAQPAPPEPTAAASATVEYAPGLTEDLYVPSRAQGQVPLVVLVPGGSWTTADPSGLAPLAARLADAGVAAAPTHLRAAQDGVTFPVPVEDVLCAVAAAAQEVRRRGLVPDPVAVLGHSSGAHLAALAVLAARDFAPDCRAPLVTPDALVGISGPYDISQIPEMATALLGTGPDDDPDGWAQANPVGRADLRPDVPVLLLHGDADDLVPVDFTTQFGAALEDAGHPTTVEVVPGATHDTIYRADVAGERVATWLQDLNGG